jgi:hypothetical protein
MARAAPLRFQKFLSGDFNVRGLILFLHGRSRSGNGLKRELYAYAPDAARRQPGVADSATRIGSEATRKGIRKPVRVLAAE